MALLNVFILLLVLEVSLGVPVDPLSCPSQCTCDVAPLHVAPFITHWTHSNVDTKQLTITNDVLDHSSIVAASGESADAGVPFELQGLHVTCAVYPDTNITQKMLQIPTNTMVLSLLQASTSNCTVIEGNQLASLVQLKALHIRGFSSRQSEQSYNDVTMVLADDALKPLLNLQILDLSYVRLVPKRVVQRLRRHAHGPLFATNMMDMPLGKFLLYADDLEVYEVPRDITNNAQKDIIKNLTEEDRHSPKFIQEDYEPILLEKENEKMSTHGTRDWSSYSSPFTSQLNLKYLRIRYAHLEQLGPEMFVGLLNLHTMILQYNNIKILPSNIFAHTPNLRHLNLGYNSIFSLEPKSLLGLTRLVSLNLEYNNLDVTGSATLPSLPSLKTLNLRGNPIKSILPDSFVFVNATEKLILGSINVPTHIHKDAFNQLSNLKTLKIFNYSSPSFHVDFFTGIPQLEELTLHGSTFSIDFDAFTSVRKLRKLVMSHCGLSKLSVDAFLGLSDLKLLDISNNYLSDLPPGVFDHLSKLEELYLQNNNLTTLAVGIFTPLNVKLLRLNDNPWHCSCNLLQLRPALTNSVVQSSHTTCHLNTKGQTMCEEAPERLVFDTRVAPTCHSPRQYKHKDVYTVANRYLRCSKYHWDPSLYTDAPEVPTRKVLTTLTPTSTNRPATTLGYARRWRLGWRPLTDYTPMPIIEIDLLSLAERDKLEEVSNDITVMPQSDHTETADVEVTTLSKEEYKQRMAEARRLHLENKRRIKQQMHLERARQVRKLLKKAMSRK